MTHKPFREEDFPDPAPEPPYDPSVLRYGEHRCRCGRACKFINSEWWCTNRRPHVILPVANEVDQ